MARKASHEPRPEDLAQRRRFRWRPRELFDLLKATGKEFAEDKTPKQAAAVAYYTLFALGPLLAFAIGLLALAFDAGAAREAVLRPVSQLIGERGAEGLATLLEGADRERVGVLGTVLGLGVLLIAAGAVFAQLKEALNRIWEVQADKAKGWKGKVGKAVRKNFLSFVGIVGTGFLLLVSLLLSALIAAAGAFVGGLLPGAAVAIQAANIVVSFGIVALVFAAMFKFLPDARIAWRDVLVGGVVTSALFLAGQLALGYYLGAGPLASRFGAAGAVVIVLVWVYYSSMIVFFGAQLTQVYANRYGSHVRASGDARTITQAMAEDQSAPEDEGVERAPPRGSRRPQA